MHRRAAEGTTCNGGRRVAAVTLLAACFLSRAAFAASVPNGPTSDEAALDAEYAGQEHGSAAASGFPDPLESVNRGIFAFNQQVDRFLLDPITRVYRFIVPDPAKRAVRRAFANLNAPSVLANDLMQREWRDAGVTAGRFVINSTFGMVGLVDCAAEVGLPRHDSDFGQTLALVGVPSGPYLVLPILGPTNVRDGSGYVVDLLFRPTTWLIGPGDLLFFSTPIFQPGEEIVLNSIQTGGAGISIREEHVDELKALKESSLDYYAALRNAFYQHRIAEIWDRRGSHRRQIQPGVEETRSAAADARKPAS